MSDQVYLGIDPGRGKCGLALLNSNEEILLQTVVGLEDLKEYLDRLLYKYDITAVVLGDGTGSGRIKEMIEERLDGVKIHLVDERGTTLQARRRYFRENPPRGWRRLIPASLQTPPEPIDGWAAVVMVENFFEKNSPHRKETGDC